MRTLALAALIGSAALPTARAALPADVGRQPTVAVLPTPASRHWVWVNDFVFPHMEDGQAHLIDGDTGRYLGTLSTGYSYAHLVLSRDGKVIYSPETYFSRGTRGKRTDVVTLYDARTLDVIGEIKIPPKRASNMPVMGDVMLTDDGRFLLIYDFTPAQSITVVDMRARRFVREIPIPGCALAFPSGPRSFFSVCGDGSLLLVNLDEQGRARVRHTRALLPMGKDPVTEKPVRVADTWYFVTFDGRIVPLEVSGDHATVRPSWSLTSAAERAQGWRPGGLQQMAVAARLGRLYAIMHQGDLATHKDPGKTVWVYDLASHRRVQRIELTSLASSIQVSTDAAPLLFAVYIDAPDLAVYDAITGRLLRTVKNVAATPTVLVTP
ncbi:MAG TPA: amine dehydrogenase large subunit [Steroidobacteraceae bacterium]|nr:amine dehydrogenase large subunit [Steroidobacteraceae bacterium]